MVIVFYVFIFVDFISRWFSQILSADFRGWFLCFYFFADFICCWCLFYFSLILANFIRWFSRMVFISRGYFSFLADSRKFYSLIFADVFLCFFFADFISRRFSRILFADFCGFHFSQILADFIRGFLRILFLADSRKFYPLIFADGFLCFSIYTSTK